MDALTQILLIIKYLIILSVCFNANAVAPETLESRLSEKQSVKRQLPANRSKRQGSRGGYNDFWHYLIDKQAYFADEHLPAHKPYGPYKPYDMHVLPPYGLPHSSGEVYDDYADSFHPNVGIFPDFQQPPTIYNGFGMQPNFFSPLGLNIHSRPQTVRTNHPLAFSPKNPPRNPNCNSNRCQSVTNPNLCYQSHRRRPHVKGDRICKFPLQSYRKTKCGICQQNGKHCNLNDANQISSENSTHIIVMHLGENNCSCTHYIKKATGVSDTDCDSNSKIEINSVEVLDDAISIPITTTERSTFNSIETSTSATIPSAKVTTTSSALNSASSKSPTKDSQSSPYLSPSNEPPFKTKVSPPPSTSSNPRVISVTPTKSPLEENIVLDSDSSIKPELNSNVRHIPSIVSTLGAFSTTAQSTSEENIVLDSNSSSKPEFNSNVPHRSSIVSTLGTFSNTSRSTSEENIVQDSSSSVKPEFNSNVPHRPSIVSSLGSFSTTAQSTSEENIVLDSNSSVKAEFNSNVPHRPSIVSTLGTFSTTAQSTSEENIILDSNSPFKPELNSNVPHRPHIVSMLGSFSKTAQSTSEENIVFHNSSSTTVHASSSRTVNAHISSFDDSASTSTPSSSSAALSTPSPYWASTTTPSSFSAPTSTPSSSSAQISTPSSSLGPTSTPKSSSAATSIPSSSSAPTSTSSSSSASTSTPSSSSTPPSTSSSSSASTSTPSSSSPSTSTPSSSSAPISTPISPSEGTASTFKISSFNSFETHSAARINTSSTKKIASESLDSSTTFRVPSTTFPLSSNSSILPGIRSTDSESNTISSNTVFTATRTPLSVTKSSLNSAPMFATTSTPSLMTTKLFASNLRPDSTLSSTSTQSPITSSTPFLVSASSPRPDSMSDYPKWSISKLIPSYFAKTTPAPASTASYTLISAPDADTANIPPTNAALDSDSKINSIPRTISTSPTKDTTFGSSSKSSRMLHQNTSSISQSSVINSNISSYSKSTGLTKDRFKKGPLLSSMHTADEISPADDISPGKDGFEITQAPIADVTSTSSLPAEELKTNHKKNGRVSSSSVASKSSIEETLAISRQENTAAHTKEERVISSVISHPTTLKEDFFNDDFEPISNSKKDMANTSTLSTAQGSKTIHNNTENVRNSFEKDTSNSQQRNSERIPLKEDDVSSTFVLSTEQESNTARVKNERIVHESSFVSSSAMSKADFTDEDLGAISKLKEEVPSTSSLSTAQGSKTIHNNDGKGRNFSENDNSNSEHHNSESIPIKEDNVSSTFVLSTEQESNTPQVKNERIVQSSFASSSAISKVDSSEEDLGFISKLKNQVPSTIPLSTKQGSRTIHNKAGGLESSSANGNKNSSNHDSKPISTKKDDVSSTLVLSTEQEFSKSQIKNERVVQSSFDSFSAISKNHSAEDDFKPISNFKDDTPSRIVLSPEQGSKSVHNKGGSLESSSVKDNRNLKHPNSKTIPIHVDDVSSSFVLSTEQEESKSQIKKERIVQSSIGSFSTMSKADSTGNDFKPISNFKDDTPSTIAVLTKQGSIIIHDIGGKGESSAGKDNRNSKHHDSKTIPIHVDDVSSSFVLSTEQEASKSQIKNERVVQSSFASSSAISSKHSTGNDFKPISNFKDDTPSKIAVSTKQGSIIIHDIGGILEKSSEKDNRNSKHHDSKTIPIHVDDVSSTFVLSTEQESSKSQTKKERIVQSSIGSSSTMSKADSTGNDFKPNSNFKDDTPSTIAVSTKQGSIIIHEIGGKGKSSSENSNGHSKHRDSEPIPIKNKGGREKSSLPETIPSHVDDVSSTFVLSSEQESSNDQIKNERIIQSSIGSSSAMAKADSTGKVSNFKDDTPSTIVVSTNQGSRTIHNKGGRLENSSEKDNRNSKNPDSKKIPIAVDDISKTFVLSTEQESSAAHTQNERVVQSSFASSSAISKANAFDDDLGHISKLKDNVPSNIVLPTNQGSRTIHNKGGRVDSSQSGTLPSHVDDVSSAFVLSSEKESSKSQIKNERIVQSSVGSSSIVSKADSTGNGFKPISNFKDDTLSTIVPATNQGSRTIHNIGWGLQSSSEKDNRNSKHHDSGTVPIHVDDVSSTFLLSTEHESSAAHIQNERVVQSSFASPSGISKADAIDDDIGFISKGKDNVPSIIVLPTNQGSRIIHNKGGREESSPSETIPIHVDDVSSTFLLSIELESSKAQTKNESVVQSSFASSSATSKNHSAGNDLKTISNLRDDTPRTIVQPGKQGSRTIHNKGERLESSSEKDNRNSKPRDPGTVPIHVDDVSSTVLLSAEQESSAAHIQNERVVQSSFASSSGISKADAIDVGLGPISNVKDNVPSTTVQAPNQASRKNHNKGGSVDNSHFETIPIHVDDVSSIHVLSTEQESSKAQIKKERIVQSSIGSSSTMSKADAIEDDYRPISKLKDNVPNTIVLPTNQGSRIIHNKGGRVENSPSKTVPIHVDDVSSTFVLSTEQESSKAQNKNERIVQTSIGSSSTISKADAIDDGLRSFSKVKANVPSVTTLPSNQGSRTIHNKDGRIESSHSETMPIHVDDVSSTFMLLPEQEPTAAHFKNQRVGQSSVGSSSTISKADAIDVGLGPSSNVKGNVPSTIVQAPNQGSRTNHNKVGRVESSPSNTIPIHVDDVSSTFVLSTEQEFSKDQNKNERVVQSSVAASSAISKNHSAGNDLKSISNLKDDTPSTIVLATNQGSRTIHNKGGRLESSTRKDNSNFKPHISERNPITVDNVSNTFVLSKEQESSAAYTKNERLVQSSFASSLAISKADAIKDDLGPISQVMENVPSTIVGATNQGSRTIHNKDGKLESPSKKDKINLRQDDSKTIPIHVDDVSSRSILSNRNSKHHDFDRIPITVDDVSSTFVLSTEQESSKAQIKNERVAQSSFASASVLSKADYTDDDLEPILQLKGDVPGTIELATEQGSRTVYHKVGREENSFKKDNTNSRYDYSEPIPIEKDKISSSFVSSTEQESTKTQRQNERVVQSSFASSAEISKNDASGNDFKSISYFNDNIPSTIGLPQIAGNQQHQQFGRMDLVAQLQNLEKLNQSSQFITNTSSSSTRHSSWETKTTSRAQSSNDRNISKSNDWRNLQSNKKYIEEQQMKMLQEDSKEMETLKSHSDNNMATFTRVSNLNSKDTKSKDLRADDMQTLAIGAISAIDLDSSDSIFSHESSEAETSRENNPTMNDNEDETTQILSSSIVREIGESEENDEGANVPLNSNGNFRALQFGSTASRIDGGNVDSSQGTLKLEAGRPRDKIHNRYNAPARLTSQSFGTLDESKENDQDSEEIDSKDDPKTTSGLSSESAKSAESEEDISDTLKLETENVGDRRNYMSTTGSRFVHVLRSPNERYSYYSSEATFAEPLVPGVYTTKRNEFEYKSHYPTTIYWRRIEPKTYISNSRLRELRPFGLDDFEDAGYSQDCYDIDMIDC